MFLLHGDNDEVVHPSSLLEANDFLIRNSVEVKIYAKKLWSSYTS